MKAVEDRYNNEAGYDIFKVSVQAINPTALSHF
jgi:hypothetical protein